MNLKHKRFRTEPGTQEVTIDVTIMNMIVEQDGWQSPEERVRERTVTANSGDNGARKRGARRVCMVWTPSISGSRYPPPAWMGRSFVPRACPVARPGAGGKGVTGCTFSRVWTVAAWLVQAV